MSMLSRPDDSLSKEELLLRLEEAEETLRAIRSGEVDALVVAGEQGDRVFTLKDATLPYQILIEEMNEGALTLSPTGVILYCNARFAEMLGLPMQTILGKPFLNCVSLKDQGKANGLLEQRLEGKSTGELILKSRQAEIPVGISLKEIRLDGELRLGVVVSDLTERKQIEEELRRYQEQLEERVSQRTLDLKIANEALSASRLAALNLMDDALNAQKEVKQINDRLRESEHRLKRAQEIAHLGSWELDLLTNQLTWSDEVYRIFGLQPQQFAATYEAFLEAVHPDDRAMVDNIYLGSIRDHKDSYEIEHRVIRRSNGEIRYLHEKCEHFRNEDGQIIRSMGIVHDITERKQAEEVLRRFELLSEHSRDIILFMRRQDGCILEANQAAIQTYGYSHEEFLALSIQDLRADDTHNLSAEQMAQADAGGILFETVHRRKDGSTFPVEVSSQGAIIAGVRTLVSIVRDITERKRAEDALRISEEKFSKAFNSSPAALLITRSMDGQYMELNQAYSTMVGYDRAELIGHKATDFNIHINSNDRQITLDLLMASGSIRDYETSIRHRSGAIRQVLAAQELIIFNGEICILSSLQDITERKQAEQRLRQLNRTLRALSNTNQVMIRATSERQYLEDVCKIVVEDCGHSMVWIGYAQDDEAKSVQPVASAGFEAGYLETLNISWGDNDRGHGPTGIAIRTEKASRCNNMLTDPQFAPWREQAIKRGYASSLVLPLIAEDKAFGAISIYSREPGSFTKDEEALLLELSGDLAYGIQAIRLRDAHALSEAQLRSARDELEKRVRERTEELAAANRELSEEIADRMEIERQLRIQTAAMDAAANGIIITDSNGIILWTNPAVSQISGYTYEDLIGQSTRIFSSGEHSPSFYRQMWQDILAGKVWQGEVINRRKDGTVYIEEQTITPVLNEDGQLSHFIAIKQDVTERKLIYAQLEESNRELTTLTVSERQQRFLAEGLVESSIVLNMSLEFHAVLDHIFEQTRRTIPYLMADIILIDGEAANVVRQWGGEGPSQARTIFENDRLQLRDFPIWEQICATKSAALIPDTQLENCWKTYFGMTWIRSYLGAPLIYNDRVIGIINLSSDQPAAFHEDMAKNLRAFAAPAAVAIQNARSYEDEQQNRKIAEILSAASVALVQTLDIQMVMETILDYVGFIVPSDIAFVILSEGDERYRIRAVRAGADNVLPESFQDQTIDMLSEPIIRSYFAKYQSTYIPDSREVSGWDPPLKLSSSNCWLGIPLESMGKILGMVVVAHAAPNSFSKNQIQLVEAVVQQAVVALQNAWLFEQVRSGRERLQQLSRHLVEIQENERKYIARELHDETSQSLTSLKLGLQVIEQKAAGHTQLMEQVLNLKNLADETLESLHHLAVNLRPASLDHLGLVDALTGLIESTRQRSGLTAHFKMMGSIQPSALTEEMESSIYRIVQESLTNVVRHAHASYVDVILEWQDEKILIIIEDDGVGIDMQKARETGHLGIIGMQERAEMLGGKLLVDSTPEIGTTLVVEIPYANSNTYSR